MLTQTRAILSYLAAKYNLYGKDLKETVRYHRVHAYTQFLSELLWALRPDSGIAFHSELREGQRSIFRVQSAKHYTTEPCGQEKQFQTQYMNRILFYQHKYKSITT